MKLQLTSNTFFSAEFKCPVEQWCNYAVSQFSNTSD